jgi:hypothetical protein
VAAKVHKESLPKKASRPEIEPTERNLAPDEL